MIVVPARACPQEILNRTRNAASAARRATAAGWLANCTFAVGGDDDAEVQSILLRLVRNGSRLVARWAGPLGQESLNFDGAWYLDGETDGARPVNWTEFSWIIEHEGQEKPLTDAATRSLEQDQLDLLGAIRMAAEGLDAVPVRVVPQGTTGRWCQGQVLLSQSKNTPPRRARCTNPAASWNDVLCEGPCRAD